MYKSSQKLIALSCILLCFFWAAKTRAAGEFIITIDTTNPGDTNFDQFEIPTVPGGIYNFHVDWGDGNTSSNVTGDITHTYTVGGQYQIEITGTFPRIYFNDDPNNDPEKILSVDQWGNNVWQSMERAFDGARNLTIPATDTPNFSVATNTSYMFANAVSLNDSLNSWDVSHITNMDSMFLNATSFNQSLNSWDVSNVTNMSAMFYGALAFNGTITSWDTSSVTTMYGLFSNTPFNRDISGWDVSNVDTMASMFSGDESFNQDIGSWDVSNVTNMTYMFDHALVFNQDIDAWDVSQVTNMDHMFYVALAFNQNLNSWNVSHVGNMAAMFSNATLFNGDIHLWNVSSTTDMSDMFNTASAFNQDVGSWDVSSVANFNTMFSGSTSFDQDLGSWNVGSSNHLQDMFANVTLSTAHYDSLLNGWASFPLQSGVTFSGGNSTYCAGDVGRDTLTTTYFWTISDGGINAGCPPPRVTNVTSSNSNGDYATGEVVTIEITFDEAATVVGTPILTLETGTINRSATYTSGSGTNILTFTYTVQSGDSASDLDYAATNSLTLAGGGIRDGSGNDAVLTLPSPGAAGSLAANKAITINATVTAAAASHRRSGSRPRKNVPPPAVPAPNIQQVIPGTEVCVPYITLGVPIKLGAVNDTEIVKKIQQFLNDKENARLVVSGVYDLDTETAVKNFQQKYKAEILLPWGSQNATGVVFTTTIAKINAIKCGETVGCPGFLKLTKIGEMNSDVPKIKAFLNMLLSTTLDVTSRTFDVQTEAAVKKFQETYYDFVLKPWGLNRGTGLWYQTTSRQANKFMNCVLPPMTLPNGVVVQ